MRRIQLPAAAVIAACCFWVSRDANADLGSSTNEVACCQLATSFAQESLRGDDIPADERFFRTEAAPPNIHFLLDSSGSMRELPQVKNSDEATFFNSDPLGTGCSNTPLITYQTAKGWKAATETGGATAYPIVDPGTGIGSDKGYPNLFVSTKIYTYMSWGDSTSPTAAYSDKTTACNSVGSNSAERTACKTCLDTRGFYKRPGVSYKSDDSNNKYFIFTGNFLNFNPPKNALARAVFKEVVANLRRVRMGWSTFNGSSGGSLESGQNPACNLSLNEGSSFDSNRSSIISGINGVSFSSSTPLAETLFNIGQYFSSSDTIYSSTYGFGTSYNKTAYKNGQLTSQNRSICWGCQASSVIIITDGQPNGDDSLPRSKLVSINGGKVTCPNSECKALEDAGDDDLLDDVAKFLYEQDLQISVPAVTKSTNFNTAGKQSLTTFGIGLGLSLPILKNAAKVGGGEYYEAEDKDELRDRILTAVSTIQTRATSFSAAAVSSLQVNRTGGAVLPRFRPSRSDSKPWTGFLYRFELGSEQITPVKGQTCDPAKAATLLDGGSGDPNDINGDGDCQDAFLFDKDLDPIIEDDDGNFVKVEDAKTPAVPFWEASNVLKPTTSATQNWKKRSIWTIVDSNSDGKLDANDAPVEFISTNASTLRPYLGIPNTTNPCPDIASQLGTTLTADQCATVVINAYRGADVFNSDIAKRDYDRDSLLADIFHSSPVLVEPPATKPFCGFNQQCLETLFSASKTPLKDTYGTDGKRDAYDEFLAQRGKRDKIALVGSNGGMLHAFQSGTRVGTDTDTGIEMYNAGTGVELWAFVPPDQLPKLKLGLDRHTYFVDGSAMVRDVWLDGVGTDAVKGDRKKQWSEYRTLAVVGAGGGGNHYFALDLTELIPNGGAGRAPSKKGDFLWIWPQPCDELALRVGQSYTNFSPRPPPIGPVALEDSSGAFSVASQKAEERWVAFFQGGFDPYLTRGRGLAMVDLRSGDSLWSIFYKDGSTNADKLTFPFASSVAMMDLGQGNSPKDDGDLLFDTATVADYGGNVWTVRFWKPGHLNSSGKVDNWFAARSFQVQSTTTAREPFTYMTSNTVQPDLGYLRTFIGSGDRMALQDMDGPNCRLSNPYGCARSGCTVRSTVTVDRQTSNVYTGTSNYLDKNFSSATISTATGGNACASIKMNVTWDFDTKNGCTNDFAGSLEKTCGGTTSTWACTVTKNNWVTTATLNSTTPTESPNRFYGFYSYGGTNTTRRFDTAAEALAYDTAYGTKTRPMTDSDLVNATSFTESTAGAGLADNGWYLTYGPTRPNERTGSGSTVLDGCTLFNTFEPVAGGSSICSATGANVARFYQANFVTGSPNCASALAGTRFSERSVVAVPGEPAVQRTVYNGVGSTGIVTLEAGSTSGEAVSETKELLQSVYQIELDRSAHDCRHEPAADGGTACK